MILCKACAGRSAYLHGLEFRSAAHAAANAVDYFFKRGAHGDFYKAGVLNVAGKGEGLCAGAVFGAYSFIPIGAVGYYKRNVCKRFNVVQHGRLIEKAMLNRARGLYAREAAFAFY